LLFPVVKMEKVSIDSYPSTTVNQSRPRRILIEKKYIPNHHRRYQIVNIYKWANLFHNGTLPILASYTIISWYKLSESSHRWKVWFIAGQLLREILLQDATTVPWRGPSEPTYNWIVLLWLFTLFSRKSCILIINYNF